MSKTFQAKSYFTYWLDAVDEHSLHSPFFYDFQHKVVKQKNTIDNTDIETLRAKLLHDGRTIHVEDLGAGSQSMQGATRSIGDIAKWSLSTAKFSTLYQRVIDHSFARNIVELGTSLGINTLYMASNRAVNVTTFEGAPEIANIALENFQALQANNIAIKVGNIDKTLPTFLEQSGKIDIAFLDANHRYEPTMRYVSWLLGKVHSQSILILDDIHYSAEMERAWNELKKHALVYGSADLYRCGFLFFNPSLNKQHVVLQF
ncbi:O-methyltransferase [Pseudochryseolinea flava]|uniref:SAM-dependent methyltransferase n=1 Tax=Pseudochryseolinea flava TaxID=2059302 RepID=A0A364XYL0_9BACT|nr:class I SAM-dependent methyltransferase [Pseudochryseolinea flava]RAV99589.1 SAM-dependent methyltransferase [Pseudochryseolinea flava]